MLEWKIEIIGYKDETISEDFIKPAKKTIQMLQMLYLHIKILMNLLVKDIFIEKH